MLDKTVEVPLAKLKINKGQIPGLPKNPRILKDEDYRILLQSIKDDPEMLSLRELIVFPLNGHFIVIGGNMRLRALQELKYKTAPCKVLTADTPLEKLKAFLVKDNVSAGKWDWDVIANEFDSDQVQDWGVDIPAIKEKKTKDEDVDTTDLDFYNSMLSDCIYESNNKFDIPTLDITKQAGKVVIPVWPWGAQSRLRQGVATFHFYVDDYRFEAIWKDPVKVLASGCRQVVEPNLSLSDATPIAYGLHQIYKKRWITRYFQECNILAYADLNVAPKFYEYNQMGLPKGWNAFWTRGYADALKCLDLEMKIAQKVSGLQSPNLVVYGGGDKVKEFCENHNLVYIEQFINDK